MTLEILFIPLFYISKRDLNWVQVPLGFDIADSYYFEELDLTHGSSTLQLVAV